MAVVLIETAPELLRQHFIQVRHTWADLCASLENEDYGLQAMPEVSPPKWHLAHTSWFFETFILKVFIKNYKAYHHDYDILFNSYYNGIGVQYPRSQRGLLSRPTVQQVLDYRQIIDDKMLALLADTSHPDYPDICQRCVLGLNHEQQHQELFCADIKYSFSFNPLYPSLAPAPESVAAPVVDLQFLDVDSAEHEIGHAGNGFSFDNEGPSHKVVLPAFKLANRLINNAEFREFLDSGAYQKPEYWLADAWIWIQKNNIQQPLYWQHRDNTWFEYTLHGLQELDNSLPVCHVNYYEADAFARWAGKRLPSEQEWETACRQHCSSPDDTGLRYHPANIDSGEFLKQCFGQVWQWTQSAYLPYPGYHPDEGAIGEYNGKFMCNQMVLRGSSCVTAAGHARSSYRNFFYPVDQWQFSGIRLADD